MEQYFKYYKIAGCKAVVTDDGWNTFRVINQKDLDKKMYSEEIDEGIKVKTFFVLTYGEQIAKKVFDEFDKIESMVSALHKGRISPSDGYGHHFEIFSIAVLHDQTYENVINNYWINGSRDGKIDAIYYDKENVYSYQIKLGNLKPEDLDVCSWMTKAFQEYRDTHTLASPNASSLAHFFSIHYEKDLKSKSLKPKTISINGRKGENILPDEIINKFLQKRFQKNRNDSSNALTFHAPVRAYLPVNETLKEVFMFVNGLNFVEAFKNYLNLDLSDESFESLFVKNVRGKMKINEKTLSTLEKTPEMFSFYNNGVSILCDFNEQAGCNDFDMYNPIIINGQQTFFTVWKACYEKGIDISNVSIPVFVKQAPKGETKNIALYNNTQLKIESLDLLSIDESLRHLQEKMLENIVQRKQSREPIYYLQLTSSGESAITSNAEEFFGKENVVQLSDFVKLYGALLSPLRIGLWKNSVNGEIKKSHPEGFAPIDVNVANKLCSVIVGTRAFISEHLYKVADLLVQFLFLKGLDEESIIKVVDAMIKESLDNGKSKADIFRCKSTYEKMKTYCNLFGIDSSSF